MSVKKNVKSPSIDSFIDKGADVKSSKDKNFKNVLIRIPKNILDKLDEAVESKQWLTRTQWIVEAIHDKLTKEGTQNGY
jgi:hypothetical protein